MVAMLRWAAEQGNANVETVADGCSAPTYPRAGRTPPRLVAAGRPAVLAAIQATIWSLFQAASAHSGAAVGGR